MEKLTIEKRRECDVPDMVNANDRTPISLSAEELIDCKSLDDVAILIGRKYSQQPLGNIGYHILPNESGKRFFSLPTSRYCSSGLKGKIQYIECHCQLFGKEVFGTLIFYCGSRRAPVRFMIHWLEYPQNGMGDVIKRKEGTWF